MLKHQGVVKALNRSLFPLVAILCLTSFVSAAEALLAGLFIALVFGNPYPIQSAKISKWALKLSVVGFGFLVDIEQVIRVGKASFFITFISIVMVIAAGELLRRVFRVEKNTGVLISFGTAICGGSAIAAMAPVIKAKDHQIAVSMAIVFALNAAGLWLFPPVGRLFGLSEAQFGLWAALGIHDTSSVVAAGAAYGSSALAIATTVKLTRAMWIIPSTLAAGTLVKSEEKISIPLFIIGFVLAATTASYTPQLSEIWQWAGQGAKHLLVFTLFLIGSGLSVDSLRRVGVRPLLMAVILWALVSTVLLLLIVTGYLSAAELGV